MDRGRPCPDELEDPCCVVNCRSVSTRALCSRLSSYKAENFDPLADWHESYAATGIASERTAFGLVSPRLMVQVVHQ